RKLTETQECRADTSWLGRGFLETDCGASRPSSVLPDAPTGLRAARSYRVRHAETDRLTDRAVRGIVVCHPRRRVVRWYVRSLARHAYQQDPVHLRTG